ncbi:zinc finger protein 596-like isoform X2 [Cimex lectularius]|uniref:C2H2-type domain-containing protein n=1 Tax=Cimex lectularius TaxID=79782 RepID=A0A8I6RS89_CIMLE|nr:zinc finger protein 596-like isoform X2 [Cimex lectularius]
MQDGNKEYVLCPNCGLRFYQLKHLRYHKKVECESRGQLRHPCDCGRRFSQEKHLRYHRKECGREYMCKMCLRVYTTKSSLKFHAHFAHGCNCGRKFSYLKDLRYHQRSECGKRFACGICRKIMFSKSGYRRHKLCLITDGLFAFQQRNPIIASVEENSAISLT